METKLYICTAKQHAAIQENMFLWFIQKLMNFTVMSLLLLPVAMLVLDWHRHL
jgi:hypothetical protein